MSSPDGAGTTDDHDPTSVHVVLRLPRDPRAIAYVRDIVRNALTLVHASERLIGDIRIAVSEACGNAVEHAVGAVDYEVTIDVNTDRFTATITDQGEGLTEAATMAEMPGPDAVRGRGMPFIRALSDEVVFTVQPGIGTTVQLIKLLDEST